MRKWQIWRRPDGETILELALCGTQEGEEEGLRLAEEFESPNWLTAYERYDGRKPAIDPAIEPLVLLLNDLPGVMTISSCAGHEEQGEAHVGLHIDSQAALVRLLPSFAFADKEDADFWVEFTLNWRRSVVQSQADVPAGALAIDLSLLYRCPDQCLDRPPTAEELVWFTAQLRQSAVENGLLSPG